MTETLSQASRSARLDTPLGTDELCLLRFHGTEGLSELFEFSIDALSTKHDIDFDKAIGKNCSLTFHTYAPPDRFFNGVLVAAQSISGAAPSLASYRLVLRPWLWILSRTSDCRIFEKKTAPAIIEEVFKDRGFSDYKLSLRGNFPALDYCVQYRETDLAFVSRLMEQHGIYYFFEHSQDKHMLVLANGASSHSDIAGHASVTVSKSGRHGARGEEYLYDWSGGRQFRSGKFELADYDYLKPNADMKGDAQGSAGYTKSKLEIFDYPGKYKEKSDGEDYAKYRLEAEQSHDKRWFAKGDAISLFPGGCVTVKGPPSSDNKKFVLLRASHSYSGQSYVAGMGDPEDSYAGDYEFLESSIPYRAPMTTPRPLVHGPQTAKVVGKDGEEIDVDEHGRILVRFFWDRKKVQSCRVRVAQSGAGAKWGGQFIPRIGHEVVVEFLEGDPDRPLITGVLYNKDNKYPYDMPANKTQSGFKSNSSKGGSGYNELMFEDKKSSENIRMHAQKDYNVTILNTETVTIGDKFSKGKEPSRTHTVTHGSEVLTISDGDQTYDISGTQNFLIHEKQNITVDDEITIIATNKITLIVGDSSIMLEPKTITIASPTINTESQLKTTVQGGTALDLLAGLIKIN